MESFAAPAYSLALEQRSYHCLNYGDLKARLTASGDGALTRIRTFEDLLRRAKPAINMTLPSCVRFLESGKWLNIYEVVALELGGASAPSFHQDLRNKLGDWYEPRCKLERLLKFDHDTHYAALNLGGGGPDYGECCVRLAAGNLVRFATTFAGDPLRVVFSEDGQQVVSDAEVLKRFATHGDRIALAATNNEHMLASEVIVDEESLKALLEDRETLIEVHIHAQISRKHVDEIAIPQSFFRKLAKLCLDYEGASPSARRAKQFANVLPFKCLLQLTDRYDSITLRQERG